MSDNKIIALVISLAAVGLVVGIVIVLSITSRPQTPKSDEEVAAVADSRPRIQVAASVRPASSIAAASPTLVTQGKSPAQQHVSGLSLVTPVSAILQAAKDGDRPRVESLLNSGIGLNDRGAGGETALHWAAAYAQLDVLAFLLQRGAEVDARALGGSTALQFACAENQASAARALLDHGADANGTNDDGMTPLQFAAVAGNAELVAMLAAAGAVLDLQDNSGTTALHLAAMYGNNAAVSALLSAGADKSIMDADGHTAAELAVANGHLIVALR